MLEAATEKYPPKNYEMGRGRVKELANLIFQQHEDTITLTDAYRVVHADESKKKSKRGRALTTEQVQERKELIAQQGSLEFRILANTSDDSEAISAARSTIKKMSKKELDDLALRGLPPPIPTVVEGNAKSSLFDSRKGKYSYTWVELGSYYRQDHGLANPRDGKENLITIDPNHLDEVAKKIATDREGKIKEEYRNWRDAVKAREGDGFLDLPDSTNLIYTRDVRTPRLSDNDREKKYEYWILIRDRQEGQSGPWPITGELLSSASPGYEGNVNFHIKSDKADLFRKFTQDNKGQLMAIVLDGMVESAATIQSAISSSGQITGKFTPKKIEELVKILRSGSLPATLKREPVSENTMGPTLGADTIRKGAKSILWAFGFVLLFMLVYYEFAGLVACVALLGNLLLTLAFMVIIDATFTLPGLAGLVLMLGMAVDANILIYERLREERDRGATLAMSLRNGYDRALPTIIDTHMTSIFTAVVLYIVGNDQLKGFGISLTVGLIISLFTSLYLTRVMFDVSLAKGWLTKLNMRRLLSKPNIDFMGIRYYWFTATVVLTLLGAGLFIYRDQDGLNIDFRGGTAYSGQLKEAMDIDTVRKLLEKSDLTDITVEQIFISEPGYTDPTGTKSKLFTVRTPDKDRVKVLKEINKTLGDDRAKLLKTIHLEKYDFLPDDKGATLAFVDPTTDKPIFASPAQVSMLLIQKMDEQAKELEKQATDQETIAHQEESRAADPENKDVKAAQAKSKEAFALAKKLGERKASLENAAKQFTLEGLGKDSDGRFQWMQLSLLDPIKDRDDLEDVLKAAKKEFSKNPQPERLENFDSQLATETQLRALYAILASWVRILLYLWFRFGNWTFGAAAVLCLIHDLFFTLGAIAACHYVSGTGLGRILDLEDFKIDLPAVAALLTLVGYSVSDTIVVFDRIREVRGKNPELTPQMINDSVNQTLSRTLLTAFSVWLVVIVLFIFGGEGVHLFAFVMVVGVIVGTYSSIYIASPLLLIFGEGRSPVGTSRPEKAPMPKETGPVSSPAVRLP